MGGGLSATVLMARHIRSYERYGQKLISEWVLSYCRRIMTLTTYYNRSCIDVYILSKADDQL